MIKGKLKIRIFGDPCLRKKSEPLKEVGPGERMLISAMLDTMYEHKGVGLAAPQVGINQQIFVVDVGDGPVVVVNPKIIKRKGSSDLEEGCLSIPGITVNVKRPQKIVVQYLDENSQPVEKEISSMLARVFQHENDHLQGRLIIDYAPLSEKLKMRRILKGLGQSAELHELSSQSKKDSPEL
jgi:peptide deformylase